MKTLWRMLPWLLLALFAAEIVAVLLPRRDGTFHVREWGRLPALLNGRIQPLDSVGRNALLQIRGTGDVPLQEKKAWQFWKHPPKLRSFEWLLEVMTRPERADQRPIFLIHHPELLDTLDLRGKGTARSGLHYFACNDLKPVLAEIEQLGRSAYDAPSRDAFQKQALKLANALNLYQRLKHSLRPDPGDHFARDLADFELAMPAGLAAARARDQGKPFDQAAFDRLLGHVSRFNEMARLAYPLLVPRPDAAASDERWATMGAALMESVRSGTIHPAVRHHAEMADAYRHDRPDAFNRALAGYRAWLAPHFAKEVRKGRAEFYFNQVKAFLHAMIIYLGAFLLAAGALLTLHLAPGLSEALRRSAFYLVLLAGAVHTFGLVFRMALEGRPPVTNLYSSAVFIGWGAMVFGALLERVFRLGLGSAAAALSGFLTLIIAHNLALGGDTMEMLQAVLDTNFWLTTHVVVITLGYSATFMAGLLATGYILLGLATPLLATRVGHLNMGAILHNMVYAIVCFALLFNTVGTVAGGIWADQSWGRFWGWDPKENGALILVLWNAAMLHARRAGLVRERGFMAMAVFGNIVTSFSWFGVNMLGIGLHSYGFREAAFPWLLLFVASQLLIIGLAFLPRPKPLTRAFGGSGGSD
ncbi:MAG: cytochrome c biogenesis protein CcsA [Verrucomicrobia bacterium]|nr:cytochrome c biogenesis protein CcsA [Verrucomicrobiota bacterium]